MIHILRMGFTEASHDGVPIISLLLYRCLELLCATAVFVGFLSPLFFFASKPSMVVIPRSTPTSRLKTRSGLKMETLMLAFYLVKLDAKYISLLCHLSRNFSIAVK